MSESQPAFIGRWAGIDYGTKRIGLALGDAETGIGSPAETIAATGSPKGDALAVLKWAETQDATRFVVGLPLNMDGTIGPQAKLTQDFGNALLACGARVVEYWDERLSSYQANEYLKQGGVHWRNRKGLKDALAAQVILSAYFAARCEADGDAGSENEGA